MAYLLVGEYKWSIFNKISKTVSIGPFYAVRVKDLSFQVKRSKSDKWKNAATINPNGYWYFTQFASKCEYSISDGDPDAIWSLFSNIEVRFVNLNEVRFAKLNE
jgi:hypothetical protein